MHTFKPFAALVARSVASAIAGSLLLAPASVLAKPEVAAKADAAGDAWSIVADLTTQVGQRMGGTAREAYARDWAVARLKALGFANVRAETFAEPGWERGEESAELTGPAPQKLAVTALGFSGATPPQGITAPLVYFATLDALKAAPEGSLAGKIAFVDHAMTATQDGSSYGAFGAARRAGPAIAAQKGAQALLIRAIGSDHSRDPHTGVTSWPAGVAPIPAGAVSVPDALLIARRAKAGGEKTGGDSVHLVLTPRFTGSVQSGNVIADLPGTNPALPPIVLACHLDSWDLATGAIDDGAGCAIITAAALQAAKAGPMARTIRLLWAGTEERGGFGGAAYAKAHAGEPHALAMESDTGADRIWRVQFALAGADKGLAQKISAALAPFGVAAGSGHPHGGTDIEPLVQSQKLAVIDLNQDMTRYFDWHHTPNDTLDKIDPAQLQQNVDVWAALLRVLGQTTTPIAPVVE